MAIKFIDPMDGYGVLADLLTRWSGWSNTAGFVLVPTGGRFGDASIRLPAVLNGTYRLSGKTFAAGPNARFAGGFWIKAANPPTTSIWRMPIMEFESAGGVWALGLQAGTGYLVVHDFRSTLTSGILDRGGTINVCDGQWHWVAFDYLPHASDGHCRVWVDGAADIDFTGGTYVSGTIAPTIRVNLVTNSGPSQIFTTGNPEISCLVVYDEDDSGALGDLKPSTHFPLSPQRFSVQRPVATVKGEFAVTGAPTAAEALDETEPGNIDVDHVDAETPGLRDLLQFAALPYTPSSVTAAVLCLRVKNTGTGDSKVKYVAKSGVSEAVSAAQGTMAAYRQQLQGFGVDPSTGLAWGAAGLANARFGYESAV